MRILPRECIVGFKGRGRAPIPVLCWFGVEATAQVGGSEFAPNAFEWGDTGGLEVDSVVWRSGLRSREERNATLVRPAVTDVTVRLRFVNDETCRGCCPELVSLWLGLSTHTADELLSGIVIIG